MIGDAAGGYAGLRAALIGEPLTAPPDLATGPAVFDTISLEDLVAADALSIHESPATVGLDDVETPMLSAKDIRLGRPASRRGNASVPGAVVVRVADVAVVMGGEAAVQVCTEADVLLGPGIHLVRGNVNSIDPQFLAGVLRAAVESGPTDLYRVSVPRVPLIEQRRIGAAFRQLNELEMTWRHRRTMIEELVRSGVRGLAAGELRPVDVEK
ncbi:hypothetical protein [Nocardia macrotermitis]|uniref:Type I restriction modification DNA specificity domain-containing protein n=1 Tax=Nocardia macrotermitis TaxID=2585198 RepID=A0A7K0CZI3_9NOCA|nr:hypothetical protein [Nocardia macrotermitis]MQY18084.1 hypothetical protein [Nocardia macrotermitis]